MSDFKTQVEDIVGESIADTSAIADFLTASAREVVDMLPDKALMLNALVNEDTTDGNGYTASNQKIFSVSRNGKVSVEVPYGLSTQIAVNSGSIHESTARTPFHYYKGKYLYIHPAPTGSEKGEVFSFTYPTFASTSGSGLDILDSDIPNFPNNAEFAVVLGASCKYFMRMISDARVAIPSALAISDLSVSANAPNAPSVSANSVGSLGSMPAYNKPTVSLDITQLETFLETDEDSELAQVQLGRINSELNQYQADIQNELNEFNAQVQEYQSTVQKALEDARLSSQDDAQLLQKYQGEISSFQATVNKEVQVYQSNLSQYIQEFSSNLQRNQSIIQTLNSQYQQCEAKYQSEIKRLSGKG